MRSMAEFLLDFSDILQGEKRGAKELAPCDFFLVGIVFSESDALRAMFRKVVLGEEQLEFGGNCAVISFFGGQIFPQ